MYAYRGAVVLHIILEVLEMLVIVRDNPDHADAVTSLARLPSF
jgi:hypothetical protein